METSNTTELTFLFTDLVSSSFLWETHQPEMEAAMARHDELLLDAVRNNGGWVVKKTGDGIHAAFGDATGAVDAAIAAQLALAQEDWGALGPLGVRTGVHRGVVEPRDGDYYGPAVNRAARLMSIAHGGQILCTAEVRDAFEQHASSLGALEFRDLGEHALKGITVPLQIFQVVREGLRAEFPILNTHQTYFRNFPVHGDPFIGRSEELSAARELLERDEGRLITLLGMGGTGKTRLASEIAEQNYLKFSHGAVFTPLRPVTSRVGFWESLAESLEFGLQGAGEPHEQLLEYLSDKSLLIVPDNFEHLTEEREAVAQLLKRCPNVRILATSRNKLNLKEERLIRIGGLPLHNTAGDAPIEFAESAERLFLLRAQQVRSDIGQSGDDVKLMGEICELLEGLPLAIELAAAWASTMSLEEILGEVSENLDFLESEWADGEAGHGSLRVIFDSSCALLSAAEQDALRGLSIFRHRFTPQAAEAVAGADRKMLHGLIDKSLVRRFGHGAFRLPRLVRTFAEERRASDPENAQRIEQNFIAYYAAQLGEHVDAIRSGDTPEFAEAVEDYDNISFAWDLASQPSQYIQALNRMSRGLFHLFEQLSRYSAGVEIFEATLSKLENETRDDEGLMSHKLKTFVGYLQYRLGNFTESRALLENVMGYWEREGDVLMQALTTQGLGYLDHVGSQFAAAETKFSESLELYRRINDDFGVANSLNNLALLRDRMGDIDEATQLHTESLEIRERLGTKTGIFASLSNLAMLAYRREDYVGAKKLHMRCGPIVRELNNKRLLALHLSNLAMAEGELGETTEAQAHLRESFEIRHEIGDKKGMAIALNNMGLVAEKLNNYEIAERMLRESLRIREEIADRWGLAFCHHQLGRVLAQRGDGAAAEREYGRAFCAYDSMDLHADALKSLAEIAQLRIEQPDAGDSAALVQYIAAHPNCPNELCERLESQLASLNLNHSESAQFNSSATASEICARFGISVG